MRNHGSGWLAAALASLVLGTTGQGLAQLCDDPPGEPIRVSITTEGTLLNNHSEAVGISRCGGSAIFSTDATFVDTLPYGGIFRHDTVTGETTRVVHTLDGEDLSGAGCGIRCYIDFSPNAVSDDGRTIVFSSTADNLVPGDTNGRADLFVAHVGGTPEDPDPYLEMLNVGTDGTMFPGGNPQFPPSISGDGERVIFSTGQPLLTEDTGTENDIYVRGLLSGSLNRIVDLPVAGGEPMSFSAQSVDISNSAAYRVVFDHSGAVYFAETFGAATRLPVGVDGDARSGFPVISADGRLVAFYTEATNLCPLPSIALSGQLVLIDLASPGVTRCPGQSVTGGGGADPDTASFSADGRYLLFRNNNSDTMRGVGDWVVFDTEDPDPEFASFVVLPDLPDIWDVRISANGKYITFTSSNVLPGEDRGTPSGAYRGANPHLYVPGPIPEGADLRVLVENIANGDGSHDLEVAIYNDGPETAVNVRAELAFEGLLNARVIGAATPGDTDCGGDDLLFECTQATLEVGDVMVIRGLANCETLIGDVTVSSDMLDIDTANNNVSDHRGDPGCAPPVMPPDPEEGPCSVSAVGAPGELPSLPIAASSLVLLMFAVRVRRRRG